MTAVRVVLTTAPRAAARRIARALVSARLAACVNLIPGVASVYRWKGRVEEARETVLVVKTTARRVPALLKAIRRLHPYDCPEGVVLPLTGGLASYLRWISAETRGG